MTALKRPALMFHVDPPAVADVGDELSIQRRLRTAIGRRLDGAVFVAVPNGTNTSAWGSIKARQEGLQPGFPDGIVLWAGGQAFVEVKARGGVLSERQAEWLTWLTGHGFNAAVFRSVDTCIDWLITCGAPVKPAGAF